MPILLVGPRPWFSGGLSAAAYWLFALSRTSQAGAGGVVRVGLRFVPDSVGKVLGQLAIVLVYTRTVLTTQYKTQFFKDTAHFQLYYTQKQLSSIILRGDIQRMP